MARAMSPTGGSTRRTTARVTSRSRQSQTTGNEGGGQQQLSVAQRALQALRGQQPAQQQSIVQQAFANRQMPQQQSVFQNALAQWQRLQQQAAQRRQQNRQQWLANRPLTGTPGMGEVQRFGNPPRQARGPATRPYGFNPEGPLPPGATPTAVPPNVGVVPSWAMPLDLNDYKWDNWTPPAAQVSTGGGGYDWGDWGGGGGGGGGGYTEPTPEWYEQMLNWRY